MIKTEMDAQVLVKKGPSIRLLCPIVCEYLSSLNMACFESLFHWAKTNASISSGCLGCVCSVSLTIVCVRVSMRAVLWVCEMYTEESCYPTRWSWLDQVFPVPTSILTLLEVDTFLQFANHPFPFFAARSAPQTQRMPNSPKCQHPGWQEVN